MGDVFLARHAPSTGARQTMTTNEDPSPDAGLTTGMLARRLGVELDASRRTVRQLRKDLAAANREAQRRRTET